jgi:Protein of unknown function (DUF3313)
MPYCLITKSIKINPQGTAKKSRVFATLLLGAASVASLSACTTIPKSEGFLSKADNLQPARGLRGKRLQTPPPAVQIADGTKLIIEPAVFTSNATISDTITEPERALILNALMRSICSGASAKFDITERVEATGAADAQGTASTGVTTGGAIPNTPTASIFADAYRLRTGVSRLIATGKVGAAIGNVTNFVVPTGGIRPPIGLGGLTVEFELLDPNGQQAGAMVWSRFADVMSSSSVSRIGDAYSFTATASQDFAALISSSSGTRQAIGSLRLPFGRRSDAICAKYGVEAGRLAGAFSALALPLPPEWTDKGEVKKE